MKDNDLGSRRFTRREALRYAAAAVGAAAVGGGLVAARSGGLERVTGTPTPDMSKTGFGLEYGARAAETASRAAINIHGTEIAPSALVPPTPQVLPSATEVFVSPTAPPAATEVPSPTPTLQAKELPSPTPSPTEAPTATTAPLPVETPKPKERLALPAEQKGAAVLAFGSEPYWLQKSPELLDRLTSMNVNAITLNFPIFMDGPYGSNVHIDTDIRDPQSNTMNGTPTSDFMRTFIAQAKAKNMDIMLRPIIDERNINPTGKWRGNIAPKDVDAWFASYTEVMVQFGKLAQEQELGGLCIGAELESMEVYGQKWLEMQQAIRDVYKGQLTYAYNHSKDGYDPRRLELAQGLDFVGIDAFFPLDAPIGATVDQIVAAWQPRIKVLNDVKGATGKEIVFAEYGAPARDTAFQKPYDDNGQVAVNDEAQKRYYEALYADNGPWSLIKGGYIWGFGPYDVRDVPDETQADSQYNIFAKPAEAVIRAAYAK